MVERGWVYIVLFVRVFDFKNDLQFIARFTSSQNGRIGQVMFDFSKIFDFRKKFALPATYLTKSNCVSLVCDFALLSQFFCKKLSSSNSSYILQYFLFGIGIWFWAVENLGSSYHVSTVHD